jgi:nitrite reductase/ring-hydroxylating ferredoxin subunit
MARSKLHLIIPFAMIYLIDNARCFTTFTPTKPCTVTGVAACSIQRNFPTRRNFMNRLYMNAMPSAGEAVISKEESDVESSPSDSVFDFHKSWYPIAVPEFLDPKKPHPVQLLGKDLVIWKDLKSGEWNVFEDACPHRLAPLSEGRVEPDGTILCAYHAWRFDGTGRCTSMPQSRKDKEQTHCSLPGSFAVPHPTMERQGLLWVWGQAGGPGSDAAILSKCARPSASSSKNFHFSLELVPFRFQSHSFSLENSPFLASNCSSRKQDGAAESKRNECTHARIHRK